MNEPARQHGAAHERLIVFTRQPRAGSSKTRLIPVLGADGAAQLQSQMTRHTLDAARQWAKSATSAPQSIEVRFTDGTAQQMREQFGDDLLHVDQGAGTLGERMHRAIAESSSRGAQRTVVIGSDCPAVDQTLLRLAFEQLQSHDMVIGPAMDGGYYLIGLRRPAPALFDSIDWGTSEVLAQTLQRAGKLKLRVAMLPEHQDVDEPADLPVWEKVSQQRDVR